MESLRCSHPILSKFPKSFHWIIIIKKYRSQNTIIEPSLYAISRNSHTYDF